MAEWAKRNGNRGLFKSIWTAILATFLAATSQTTDADKKSPGKAKDESDNKRVAQSCEAASGGGSLGALS